jgi:hypothetical protein
MSEAFKTVSSGFRLVYIGFLLVVLAIVIAVVAIVGAMAGAFAAAGLQGVFGMLYLYLGLLLLGQIIEIVGGFQCMSIPERVGAKQTIVFSVAMNVVALTLLIIELADVFAGPFLSAEVRRLIGPAGQVLSLIAILLFLRYTGAVATFIRRNDLAAGAQSVTMFVILMAILVISSQVVLHVGVGAGAGGNIGNAAGAGCVVSILGLAIIVVFIVFAIRYANLLSSMSQATMTFARRGGDYDDDDDRPRGKSDSSEDDDDWDR